MPFAIYKARASEGAVNLKNALGATLLRSEGSQYRGRANKILINWGSSSEEAQRLAALTPAGNVLNQPLAVGQAANKLNCLQILQEHGVQTVPWYTQLNDAMAHAEQGRIYARTRLTGHSGEGIELMMSRNDPQAGEADDLPFPVSWREEGTPGSEFRNARLFTVGITGKRQEWRIHVCNGEVILSQLKVRRQGFQDNEGYTSLVRNIETGWVYSVNFDRSEYPQLAAVQSLAVGAIEALGLDFGAVDIVEKRGEGYVLEVNTAPGLDEEGSSLRAYTEAFQAFEQQLLQGRQA